MRKKSAANAPLSGSEPPSIDQLLNQSNWEDRLAEARAKREKLMAERAGKAPVPAPEPPKFEDADNFEFVSSDPEPDSGEEIPTIIAAPVADPDPEERDEPVIAAPITAAPVAASTAQVVPLRPEPTIAPVEPVAAEQKRGFALGRVAIIAVACFFGMGFGLALGLGVMFGMGWVSPSEMIARGNAVFNPPPEPAPIVLTELSSGLSSAQSAPILTASVILPAPNFDKIVRGTTKPLSLTPQPVSVPATIYSPGPRVQATAPLMVGSTAAQTQAAPALAANIDPEITYQLAFLAPQSPGSTDALPIVISPSGIDPAVIVLSWTPPAITEATPPVPKIDLPPATQLAMLELPNNESGDVAPTVIGPSGVQIAIPNPTWQPPLPTTLERPATTIDTRPSLRPATLVAPNAVANDSLPSIIGPSGVAPADLAAAIAAPQAGQIPLVEASVSPKIDWYMPAQPPSLDAAALLPSIDSSRDPAVNVGPIVAFTAIIEPKPIPVFGPVSADPVIELSSVALPIPLTARLALPDIGPPPDKPATLAAKLGFDTLTANQIRLFLHAPDNVPEPEVTQRAEQLGNTGFILEKSRRVSFKISKTHVRYYNSSDAAVANAIATELGGKARDFSANGGTPGRIEIWLEGTTNARPVVAKPKKTTKRRTTAKPKAKRADPAIQLRNRLISRLRRGDHLQ